ncbi:hypothetical protein, partial [Sphingomonas sp.]|uniref:hypothetical protein n=1 Tax=Sphingomonas sp. TaxID=28214 RepID=UPI003569D220
MKTVPQIVAEMREHACDPQWGTKASVLLQRFSDELEAAMGAQSVGRFGVSDGRVSLSLDDMQIGLILAIGGCE